MLVICEQEKHTYDQVNRKGIDDPGDYLYTCISVDLLTCVNYGLLPNTSDFVV